MKTVMAVFVIIMIGLVSFIAGAQISIWEHRKEYVEREYFIENAMNNLCLESFQKDIKRACELEKNN